MDSVFSYQHINLNRAINWLNEGKEDKIKIELKTGQHFFPCILNILKLHPLEINFM